MRPTVSTAPPGGNGTMNLTGLSGKLCACAVAAGSAQRHGDERGAAQSASRCFMFVFSHMPVILACRSAWLAVVEAPVTDRRLKRHSAVCA